MEIRNILVPTDFSECADNALAYAAKLAGKLESRLTLMHSVQNIYSFGSQRLMDLVKEEGFGDLELQTVTEIGEAAEAILRSAEDSGADIIIMANKGTSGGRKLLGSTTLKVASEAPIPVLTVPDGFRYSGMEKVAFTTDYHEGDLQKLEEVINLTRAFNSGVHVLHIDTEKTLDSIIKFRGFKKLAAEKGSQSKLTFVQRFNASVLDGIDDYLRDHSIDLLVISRYGKSFLQAIRETNHTRQFGLYLKIPQMILSGDSS